MSSFLNSLVDNVIGGPNSLSDNDWMSSTFMTSRDEAKLIWESRKFYTSADAKFTDSSLGGSFVCNPLPQFTRYADCRSKGRRNDATTTSIYSKSPHNGQGEYYSKNIDDNMQILLVETGVPEFGSIFSFISASYDQPTSSMAKHVTSSGVYEFGQKIGGVIAIYKLGLKALLPLSIWAANSASNLYFGDTASKYYWLKPNSHVYWSAVNTMVTHLATELGVIQPIFGEPEKDTFGSPLVMTQDALSDMEEVFGNILKKDSGDAMASTGFVDVRRLVSRANAVRNDQIKKANKLAVDGTMSRQDIANFGLSTITMPVGKAFNEFLDEVLSLGKYSVAIDPTNIEKVENPKEQGMSKRVTESGNLKVVLKEKLNEWQSDTLDYIKAASTGANRYVAFRVNYLGQTTLTIENGITDIPTQNAMNEIGGATRNIEFMTAGGNIFTNGFESVTRGIIDLGEGVLSGLTFGASNVLNALLGGGYVEMPKMWDNSTVSLEQHIFKFHLPVTCNNPVAVLTQQLIPLCMTMVAGMPMSTGPSTYTSPPLLSAFLRGQVNINLGIITSLTITSGVGNLGHDANGRALGYDVEFTITDLDHILKSPISSFVGGSLLGQIDDTNAMGRYLTKLGGRDITTAKYNSKKFLLRSTTLMSDLDKVTSPGYLSSLAGDFLSPVTGMFLEDTNFATFNNL